jgi:predicted transcriptional regulator
MATTIRKPASFRLRADLLEGLKRNAARENRTLNNYVESVLLDIVYHEPNSETKVTAQPLRRYTMDDINAIIDEAEAEIAAGLGTPHEEVMREMDEEIERWEQEELQQESAQAL